MFAGACENVQLQHFPLSVPRQIVAHFLDQENGVMLVMRECLDPVAGLLDQMRDVDRRERIGAVNLQTLTDGEGLERLTRPQHRQRAFQASQIEHDGGQESGLRLELGEHVFGVHREPVHHDGDGVDVVEMRAGQIDLKLGIRGDACDPRIGRI